MPEKARPFLILLLPTIIILGISLMLRSDPSTDTPEINTPKNKISEGEVQKEINLEEKIMTKSYESQPVMQIDQTKKYTAVLHTDKGDIKVELYADKTPITVNNFVFLAMDGFYNETIFHRVIKGFMIQGGDPLGNGTGGPGYKFADEEFDGEYTKGTIAMANSGPDTNGSQFFIMHADTGLPKNYTIFGKVTEGLDIVDTIANSEVTTSRMGEKSTPITPTVISNIEIIME